MSPIWCQTSGIWLQTFLLSFLRALVGFYCYHLPAVVRGNSRVLSILSVACSINFNIFIPLIAEFCYNILFPFFALHYRKSSRRVTLLAGLPQTCVLQLKRMFVLGKTFYIRENSRTNIFLMLKKTIAYTCIVNLVKKYTQC